MTDPMQTEREAFEAWAKEHGFNIDARFENVGKLSQFLATQHAWEGWQAALSSLASELRSLRDALALAKSRIAELEGARSAVALDIARWFVNGDRPDEWKLQEWVVRLDRDAVAKAYEERSA